jgi:NitT/TauT family transport system ATP-binding protein
MAHIQARQVCRAFNIRNARGLKENLTVLEHFSLDINEGEFLSLLGPSGCGKSTFLNILAGLDKFDAGEILVDGKPLQEHSFNRGIIFQSYALLPWRTVIKNLEVGLEIRGIGKKERRRIARHYIELVGLAAFENQYPHQLSGGMRQRVAIARVLAYQPDLLLMDEPFAALDAQTRENLQIELLRIWETDKKTILFVTHSIDEAILMSDRVAFMCSRPGRIKEIIDIDLPRPRTEDIRNSAEFALIRKNLWGMLQAEAAQIQSYGAYL